MTQAAVQADFRQAFLFNNLVLNAVYTAPIYT